MHEGYHYLYCDVSLYLVQSGVEHGQFARDLHIICFYFGKYSDPFRILTTKIQVYCECNNTPVKICCSVAALLNWQVKDLWNSYLIKWSDGEKEQDKQEEEAATGCSHTEEKNALQNQKR